MQTGRLLFLWIALAAALSVASCGRARALAEEGMERMKIGKETSALELFDRALRSNEKEPLALYGKGMLLSEEEITQDIALAMLKQAVESNTLQSEYQVKAYLKIAQIYTLRKNKSEALQNLAHITGASRLTDGETVRKQATLYLELKEKNRAREVVTAYLEGHANDEVTEYFLLKLYAVNLRETKLALKLCGKTDWAAIKNAKFVLNCARLKAADGDFKTAIVLLDDYAKRAGQSVGKEVNELREGFGKKRGKFEPVEADF